MTVLEIVVRYCPAFFVNEFDTILDVLEPGATRENLVSLCRELRKNEQYLPKMKQLLQMKAKGIRAERQPAIACALMRLRLNEKMRKELEQPFADALKKLSPDAVNSTTWIEACLENDYDRKQIYPLILELIKRPEKYNRTFLWHRFHYFLDERDAALLPLLQEALKTAPAEAQEFAKHLIDAITGKWRPIFMPRKPRIWPQSERACDLRSGSRSSRNRRSDGSADPQGRYLRSSPIPTPRIL